MKKEYPDRNLTPFFGILINLLMITLTAFTEKQLKFIKNLVR